MEQIKILHVDDGSDFLALTKAHLEEKDGSFSVATATTAQEGIKLLKDSTYDVVLSDYQMPGMDGLEFLQHLRESGSKIPFIMLTGKGREEVAIAALNKGANHYIQKGKDIESLYGTLAHVIQETVEKRRAGDKLAAIEKERQIILDSVPAMIFHVDTDGNYVYANKRLADAGGLKIDDFVGKSPRDIFPERGEDYAKSDEAVLKSGKPKKEVTGIFRTPAGKKWVKSYKTPLKDAEGTVTGLIGLAVDITERKQVEEELRNTQKRLSDTIEFLPDATFVIDRDKKVIAWNRAVEVMTGVRKAEIVGKGDYAYAVPFYGAKRPVLVDLIFSRDEGIESRYDYVKRKGDTLFAEVFMPALYGGKGAYLWAKASPLFDNKGTIIGAIESVRDITDRKRAEEAQREIEERYRRLVELSFNGITIHREGKIVSLNPAGAELFGGTNPEQFIGKPVLDFVHPDYHGIVQERLQHMEDRGEAPLIEEKFIRLDGTVIDVEVMAIPIIHQDQPSMQVVFRDITERKRAEEALQEREKEHQIMLDSVPVSIFHIDSNSKFVQVNKALAERYGKNPEDFRGRTSKELFPEDAESFIRSDKEVLESGEPQIGAVKKIATPEGEKWVQLDKVSVKNADGEVTGIIGFELDITGRKQAEEALRESEKQYRLLFNSGNDAVFVHRVTEDGIPGKIIDVNDAACNILGYTRDELLQISHLDISAPDELDNVPAIRKKLLANKDHLFEIVSVAKDGRKIPFEISALLFNLGGQPAVLSIARDITWRKRAGEERERFLRELEAKNTEMERFTYTISHDLRSPLFAIQGFSSIAREDVEQGKLENLASDLKKVESASEKMDRLLNDTLKLSRVGRMVNPPEDVPFGNIVDEALEQVAMQLKSSGVDVSTAKGFPTVHVDRERIEEMLVNLIGNSIKYMSEQPSPRIDLGYRVEGDDTVFFVKDNGIGIDPRLHSQVFELFYQVDKRIKGTGAGLAIVKRIVEVHGGRIWIESEEGNGCAVCFTLPVQ